MSFFFRCGKFMQEYVVHMNQLSPEGINDAELVSTLKEHRFDHSPASDDAMSSLIRLCTPEVDMVLRKTGIGWSDLADLEQEVFLQVLRHIDQLRDPVALHGWVKKIARHVAINYKRKQRLQTISMSAYTENEDELGSEDDKKTRPLAQLINGERQKILFAILEEMKPVDRLRLRQFYLLDMSLQEIVDDAGGENVLPLGTVKRQLFTARNRFKEALWPSLAQE